ncbi:MAG: DUF1499 domain-containing protein [Alphaproteobacteria bacterium]
MLSTTLAIVACVAALILALRLIGPERVWRLWGPPDLGPVAFETLVRRKNPNDALAAPTGFSPARVDILPTDFPVPPRALAAAFTRALADEPRLEKVAEDADGLSQRWVQRSALLRYPDTIAVRFLDRPGGHSTIALYGRSQIGRSDFGVNRARIVRWLDKLAREVPPVR